MDTETFRVVGKEMVDYIANYLDNVRERRPVPDVEPGYLHQLMPDKAPEEGESWEAVFSDVERIVMPGVDILQFSAEQQNKNKQKNYLKLC